MCLWQIRHESWLPDPRSTTLAAHITAFSPCLIPTCGCINVSVCCRSDIWQLLHLVWVQRWCLAPPLSKCVAYNCTRHVSSTSACCCLCLLLFFSPFLSNWQYKHSLILFCSAVNHVVAPMGRPHPRAPCPPKKKGEKEWLSFQGRACNRAREDYEMCKGYACRVCGTKWRWSQLLARSGLDLPLCSRLCLWFS